MSNKRYQDLYDQYIYRGEPTPITVGTIAVCFLCFLIMLVATFSQITFSHPWIEYTQNGFSEVLKKVLYSPQIPAMIFVIYILRSFWTTLTFVCYLLIGFFILPIFAFGGGFDYIQNYFFGYLVGSLFAIFAVDLILKKGLDIKTRLLAAFAGIVTIHASGFIYCILLAIFKVIDFNMVIPVLSVLTFKKIIYDIIFGFCAIIIAPYIKNVLWICMKPKYNNPKNKNYSSKKYWHTTQNSQ